MGRKGVRGGKVGVRECEGGGGEEEGSERWKGKDMQ
jgi:hypothetical protein